MVERRFLTAEDTPCPIRLGRFGYARTGDFRAPKNGELYIVPTKGPELQADEPHIAGACQDFHEGEQRHIVVEIPDETREALEHPLAVLFYALAGPPAGFPEGGE